MTERFAARNATAIRAGGWAFFVMLAAIRVGLASSGLSQSALQVLGDFDIYLLPILLTLLGAGLIVRFSTGIEHRFWGLLFIASALLLMSEVYWTWYAATIDPRGPPVPAPYELLQLAAALLFFAIVVTMTTFGSAPAVARVRFYVDVLGGMVVAHALVYWYWTLPLLRPIPDAGWPGAAVSAAYPVLGGTMLIATAVVVFGGGSHRLHGWERLVAGSIAAFGATLCVTPFWYATVAASAQTPQPMYLTVALGFGYYLLFMATVYRWTSSEDAALEPLPVPKPRPLWLPALYPIALAAALPIMGIAAMSVAGTPSGIPIVGASLALTALLVVRSWLAGLERAYHRTAAITDPVSGAYNHRYLHERLTAQMAQASASGTPLAVGVLDIDGFRVINAMHGQTAGDRALVGIARVLEEEGGPDAATYRLGGDEFAFVVRDAGATEATEIARRAIARVANEIEFAGSPVRLSAGIAVFPTHAFDSEQIVTRAIAAQQLARVSDDSDVVVYDEAVVGATDPLERLARARKHSHRTTVKALAAAVDARDPDTRHHSQNVADLATALALVLDVSQEQTHVIELAAQMHDVGKLGVTDEVLMRQEPLSPQDKAAIEEHPVLGERILAAARLDEILPAVRHHHERWDGKGYPDGLAGYEIPLAARMLSVCDAFEAMTSLRRYRQTLSVPQAIAEIERCAGTQFDPDIAHVFARMVGRLHGQALRDSFSG